MSKNATTHMSISDKKKYKQQKLDEVAGMFSASSDSFTVKDVSVDLKIPVESARKYVRELFKSGLVCVANTKGNTHSYKWADGNVVVTEEKEEQSFETPGKEFEPDEFIPCDKFCKQGDIVYISSRSGEGAFFRYLILTPWDRKATVIGVIEEGNPRFDENDPNLIFVGTDPESGINLYADITNTCARGYKNFGERCMHVETDKLQDVKNRLIRTMQLSMPSKVDDQSVKDTLSKFRKASDIQKKELSDSKEKIRNLQVDLNNLRIKMRYKDDTIRQLIEERDVLSNHVKEAVAEKKAVESKYALVSKLPTTVHSDAESKITIARLEERNKCLTEYNSLLEKIIFKLTD